MHALILYSTVSISARHLKCLASPIPKLQFKQEAQLPQRDRATRHVSRFCYVSRSWELDRFQTAKVAFNPNPNANSLKDIGNDDIRQATCDFLLVLFSTMSLVHL